MSFILSKREFLKGMIAAPAIVAVSSIMPIKPAAAGIFKLETFTEIPSYDSWSLIRQSGGSYAWMMSSEVEKFVDNGRPGFAVIKEIKRPVYPMTTKEKTQFEVDLMSIHPGGIIVGSLPLDFCKPRSIII